MRHDSPKRRVAKVSGWQFFVLFPLAILVRIWAATLRFEVSTDCRRFLAEDQPHVSLIWHNRLFVVAEIYRRLRKRYTHRPLYALISGSQDGAWLAAFFRFVGLRAIRGSSSWRASEALREIIRVAQAGGDIGITPDGPRGPCYHFQPGALLVAKKASLPILTFGVRYTKAKRLGSWDGFYLPLPFSRVKITVKRFENYAELVDSCQDGITPARTLEALLTQLNPDS